MSWLVTVFAIRAGPGEESAGVVGEGGQGAFAAVGEGGELDGAAADDGGEVGGRARPGRATVAAG